MVPPWHPGHLRPAQAVCSQPPEHQPLCCQSVGLKQQSWKTCTHHLAGCMQPCPQQTCRPGPLHQHHRQCWFALQLASQQQLEVRSSCDQRWAPRLWKLPDRHCHSHWWPAKQPGSLHRTRWYPPVTSAGPLGGCGNCPGSRWSCRHWPWCTSAQGSGKRPSPGWGRMTTLTCNPCCAVHVMCGAGFWLQCRAWMQHCWPLQHAALPLHLFCRTHSIAELYAGTRWQQQQQETGGCAVHPVCGGHKHMGCCTVRGSISIAAGKLSWRGLVFQSQQLVAGVLL